MVGDFFKNFHPVRAQISYFYIRDVTSLTVCDLHFCQTAWVQMDGGKEFAGKLSDLMAEL